METNPSLRGDRAGRGAPCHPKGVHGQAAEYHTQAVGYGVGARREIGEVAVISHDCKRRHTPALKTGIARRWDLQAKEIHRLGLVLDPLIQSKLRLKVATHGQAQEGLRKWGHALSPPDNCLLAKCLSHCPQLT